MRIFTPKISEEDRILLNRINKVREKSELCPHCKNGLNLPHHKKCWACGKRIKASRKMIKDAAKDLLKNKAASTCIYGTIVAIHSGIPMYTQDGKTWKNVFLKGENDGMDFDSFDLNGQ